MQSEYNFCIVCGDTADTLIATYENAFQLKEKLNEYLPIKCENSALATQTKHKQQCCIDCVNTICNWDFFYKRCKEVQQQITKYIAADTSEQLSVEEHSLRKDDKSILFGAIATYGTVYYNTKNQDDPQAETEYDSDISLNEHNPCDLAINTIENEGDYTNEPEYQKDIGVDERVDQGSVRTHSSKIENRFFKSRNRKICTFCKFNTAKLENLNQHLINEHWKLIFCCNICNSYLPRLQLMSHMTEHALKSRTITTAAAPAVTPPNSPNSSLNQNQPREVETLNFTCEKCNATFRSISGIKYHINAKHTRMKTFDCCICNYKFTSKRVLENHNRSLHGRDKRNYVCHVCDKAFKTDSNLYTHQKLHSTERPFRCVQCSKSFRLKHHLNGHMVQHKDFTNTNSLPYECNCCHKKFAAMDNLRKHKKIHDQTLSDFICHICGAKMKQKRYLRQHMRKVHLQKLTA